MERDFESDHRAFRRRLGRIHRSLTAKSLSATHSGTYTVTFVRQYWTIKYCGVRTRPPGTAEMGMRTRWRTHCCTSL